MTNRIVVGVDGSEPSNQALRWAAYEARRRNATVLAIACYSVPVMGSPEGAVYASQDYLDNADAGAQTIVAAAAELVTAIDARIVVEQLTSMEPAAVVIADAAHAGDAIVIGASGHGGFLNGLGSVATSVVHRSHVPVIVVPVTPAREIGPAIRTIVVGVDGSDTSLAALAWAQDQATLCDAALTPLQLADDSIAAALIEASREADLLVIGSHGHGALRSSLLGSVSHDVAQNASCPVAVIRVPQE